MTESRILRTLIVDDEEPARWRLRELLQRQSDVALVGECDGGAAAISAVRTLGPDLLLLDVQMPEVNGFDVLAGLDTASMPMTIFVTAFDTHAVRAFEAHSLDYVMKPYSDERFVRAIERARTLHRARAREAWADRVGDLVRALGLVVSGNGDAQTTGAQPVPAARPACPLAPAHLLVRAGARSILVAVCDIQWIEAAGIYVQVHTADATYLHRMPLAGLEHQLASAGFVRIHRSAIINLAALREVIHGPDGDLLVVLGSQARVPVSRRYRSALKSVLDPVSGSR